MTDENPSATDRPTGRASLLSHIKITTNRSGPEVVTALNKSLRYFEDLHLAQGEMQQLCYVPVFKQSFYMYVANSPDPDVAAKIERNSRLRARCDALLVLSDEEEQELSANDRSLQLLSVDRQSAMDHTAVPQNPPPKLVKSVSLKSLKRLAEKAATGIFEPSEITVEVAPSSLKKLREFLVRFPAGPLLTVMVAFEFDGRKIWSDAVGLSRPDMLPAPLTTFWAISPGSSYAWPHDMPTETRIACFLRALALFAQQIGRQSQDELAIT